MVKATLKRRRNGGGDYKYLSQPRGEGTTWYVVVEVPRSLRQVMGCKRLTQSLKTTDINVARASRWQVVSDLKARITNAGKATKGLDDPLTQEAMAWREAIASVEHPAERELYIDRIADRAAEIQYSQRPVSNDPDDEPPADEAKAFFDLATGKATPIDAYLDRWLDASGYQERTKADARTVVRQLQEWCLAEKRRAFIETVDDRLASDFRDLGLKGVHPRTVNKKLSALRQYWKWLGNSFGIKPNPWQNKSLPKRKAHLADPDGPDAKEREFTDDEIRTLLGGNADRDLADFMRIAALSGMRLNEIGQLRVRDIVDGHFCIRWGKTAAARRNVPIHSDLKSLVQRRISNRPGDAYLFPDLPDTGWDNNRTMAISKRFGYYRKRLGVDDTRPGAKRSKVNFHSFRRWFATQVDEAGHRENVVAAVMGHAKGVGITLGHYSNAELTKAKRECVESVKLPK